MEAWKTEYGRNSLMIQTFSLSTVQTYVSVTPAMTSAGRHSVSPSYRSQQGNNEVLKCQSYSTSFIHVLLYSTFDDNFVSSCSSKAF